MKWNLLDSSEGKKYDICPKYCSSSIVLSLQNRLTGPNLRWQTAPTPRYSAAEQVNSSKLTLTDSSEASILGWPTAPDPQYYRWPTAPRPQYSADESSSVQPPPSPETIEADESSASIQPPSSLHPASPAGVLRPTTTCTWGEDSWWVLTHGARTRDLWHDNPFPTWMYYQGQVLPLVTSYVPML